MFDLVINIVVIIFLIFYLLHGVIAKYFGKVFSKPEIMQKYFIPFIFLNISPGCLFIIFNAFSFVMTCGIIIFCILTKHFVFLFGLLVFRFIFNYVVIKLYAGNSIDKSLEDLFNNDDENLEEKEISNVNSIKNNPKDAIAYFNRGNAKGELGDYTGAIEDL